MFSNEDLAKVGPEMTISRIQEILGCNGYRAREVRKELRRRSSPPVPRPSGHHPTILVVGDAHFAPGQDLQRATALGRWIAQNLGPEDHVVSIGDWFSMDSLCRFNSKLDSEGKRILEDLDAGNIAIRKVMQEVPPDRRPHFHVTLGNHEARLDTAVKEVPALEGLLGDNLFEFEAHGWHVVPFLEPLRLCGWRFQHYYQNTMGRAISSEKYQANAVLEKTGMAESVVHGHTHKLSHAYRCTTVGGPRHSINVGWFGDHVEDYAGVDNNAAWWAGLVVLRNAHQGDADIEFIRMATVKG